jgi:hypothetical protein
MNLIFLGTWGSVAQNPGKVKRPNLLTVKDFRAAKWTVVKIYISINKYETL